MKGAVSMYTVQAIRSRIVPVPQKVNLLGGAPLVLTPSVKFRFTAPEDKNGPVKTAREQMVKFLQAHCGESCFCSDGLPVVLSLEAPPENLKNAREAYRIQISAQGIAITGYGDSGLFYGVGSFCQLCR